MDALAPLPHAARPPYGPAAEKIARTIAEGLPPALGVLWATSGGGFLLVADGEWPRFESGPFLWREVQARGAIYLPPRCPPYPLWEAVGGWLDHLAGSLGGAPRLSEGHGATPALRHAATRLAELLALGYASDLLQTTDPPTLLARAIAAHRLAPRPLSAADPRLAKWLRATLFCQGFWRQVQAEVGYSSSDGST